MEAERSSETLLRSINDLFRPHDYIRPVVSLMVVQVFFFIFFDLSMVQELWVPNAFSPAKMTQPFLLIFCEFFWQNPIYKLNM
jgi:hypothetical protein